MTIQIINYSGNGDTEEVVYSQISAPRSLDEFDLDIIDLSSEAIWYSDTGSFDKVNSINDLKSIGIMVRDSKKAQIIFVLPQDIDFHFSHFAVVGKNGQKDYRYEVVRYKDILGDQNKMLFSTILPKSCSRNIVYENTLSEYGEYTYHSSFFFEGEENPIVSSKKSCKATMVRVTNNVYLTTMDITSSKEKTVNFINEFLEIHKKEPVPDWMSEIIFGDDVLLQNTIREHQTIIESSKAEISRATNKLEINNTYKSILYTSGDELVGVVFSILEQMLSCDLSHFNDVKKEDFLIKMNDVTFIGEIKGVTSNLKSSNISQLESHYQEYMDNLEERGVVENVRKSLIINPLRDRPIKEREEVHNNQITYAKRNDCLVIETITLLRLFEKFLDQEIDSEYCVQLFKEETGLLKLSAISK